MIGTYIRTKVDEARERGGPFIAGIVQEALLTAWEHMTEQHLTPQKLERFSQNKPSLVARDLQIFDVPQDVTYRVLLARGVFKWLAARRQMIKLKDELRAKIRDTHKERANLKNLAQYHRDQIERVQAAIDGHAPFLATGERCSLGCIASLQNIIKEQHHQRRDVLAQRQYLKGYLKGLEEARASIRAIAHGPRWQAPDNDKQAQQWLEREAA